MSTGVLTHSEMAVIDLIKHRLAELGFPMGDASPESVAAAAMKFHRLRKDKDGFGNSIS